MTFIFQFAAKLLKKAKSPQVATTSPLRRLSTPRKNQRSWSRAEESALIQFIALHRSEQHDVTSEWPGMKVDHQYWGMAKEFVVAVVGPPAREGV